MAKDYKVNVVIHGKDKASRHFETFSKGVSKWMKLATAAAITAAVAFSTMSVKWGMDFEAQMSSVEAVSRATAGEMAALTEKAKQLGRDSAYSASESGKAMEFLAMAGLKPGQVLEAVGDTLNLATAADIASNALTAFKLPAEEMGHVADVMALTAASANTSVLQLGEALSYAAPIASTAGWSIEKTSAAIGMLGGVGIQGSRAGTVINAVISGLTKTSGEAAKAMEELGLIVEDSTGKLLPFEEIISQIDPAILETVRGMGLMEKVFGRRGKAGIIELIKQGSDQFAGFTEQLRNSAGAAEEMAKTKLDNLKGALTLLKSSLEGVGIALVTGGENSLVGGLKSYVTEGIIPALNATSQWIEKIGGLPGMFKMAWEIIVAFTNQIKEGIKKLSDWDTFSSFITTWGIVLGGLLLSFSQFGGELILAVGEIAKWIWLPFIAPYSVMISKIMEKVINFLNWSGEKFVAGANKLLNTFNAIFEKLGIDIKMPELKWVDPLTYKAITMEEAWEASFVAIGESSKKAYDRMKNAIKDLITNLRVLHEVEQEGRGMLGLSNKDFLKIVAEKKKKYEEIGKGIAESLEEIPKALEGIPPAAEEAAKALGPGGRLWEAITKGGRHITESFKKGWEGYVKSIPSFGEEIEASLKHMHMMIQWGMSDTLYDFLRTGTFTVKHFVKNMNDLWKQVLSDMAAALLVETGTASIKWAFGKLWGWIDESAWPWITNAVKAGLDYTNVIGYIKAFGTLFGSGFKTVWPWITNAVKAGLDYTNVIGYIKAFGTLFGSGFKTVWHWITNAVKAGLDYTNVIGYIKAFGTLFGSGFKTVWNWITNAVKAGLDYKNVIGYIKAFGTLFGSGFKTVWNRITNAVKAGLDYKNVIGYIKAFGTLFGSGFKTIWNMIVASVKFALDYKQIWGFIEKFGSLFNSIKNKIINAITDALTSSEVMSATGSFVAGFAGGMFAAFISGAAGTGAGAGGISTKDVLHAKEQIEAWSESMGGKYGLEEGQFLTPRGIQFWTDFLVKEMEFKTFEKAWERTRADLEAILRERLDVTEGLPGYGRGKAAVGDYTDFGFQIAEILNLIPTQINELIQDILPQFEYSAAGLDKLVKDLYSRFNFTSSQFAQIAAAAPTFHTGGLLYDEGLFRGLRGEGVLNRTAMGMLGESGLAQLNAGQPAVQKITVIINAMDGESVERVFEERIVPMMQERSEAGVEIIHERGIKRTA